jgi:hypothetical protein
MKTQPFYTNLLTREFFEKHYVEKKMSYPKIREMLSQEGYNIHVGTLQKYAIKFGIGRNSSEARRNWDEESLDYNKTYIINDMKGEVDGFLLGDGGIGYDNRNNNKSIVARFSCGVEYKDFCEYLMKPFEKLGAKIAKRDTISMNQGFIFSGSTRHHPDVYKQYLRWYPENREGNRVKQPPDDVVISPDSVMRWYLGDGSVVVSEGGRTIILRLSTDGFAKERVEFLVDKLNKLDIKCHRSNENRIIINARGVPAFFEYIGTKNPISPVYDYKFNRVPNFRLKSKRMKEVSEELGINYSRLSYYVKIGKINCFRISEKGKPRFMPEHIEKVKELIKTGELY